MNTDLFWLSVDWGTTNFRLRLVDTASLRVLAEITSGTGVAAMFQTWKETTGNQFSDRAQEQRLTWYKNFLLARIRELESLSRTNLDNVLVVLSGMAGSTIGMTTLPYQPLPCAADGSELYILQQAATADYPFRLALVSGVCSANDIMRGEETMLVGAAALSRNQPGSVWYIFPGTHSKHVFVDNHQITKLRTYMTGELFALLSEKSILAGSVEKADPREEPDAFAAGLTEGRSGRFTHSLFSVRTGDVLKNTRRKAGYCFLSGLMIGHELMELECEKKIVLVGSGPLFESYRVAIRLLLPQAATETAEAASALIRGQSQIAARLFT